MSRPTHVAEGYTQLQETRRRMWDAAASDNRCTYHVVDDDKVMIHDPAIMRPEHAVILDMSQVFMMDYKLRKGIGWGEFPSVNG